MGGRACSKDRGVPVIGKRVRKVTPVIEGQGNVVSRVYVLFEWEMLAKAERQMQNGSETVAKASVH